MPVARTTRLESLDVFRGLTMAAMAGALGVTLEKRGLYRLGDGPPPDPAAMDRAMAVARWTGVICVGIAALALVGRS